MSEGLSAGLYPITMYVTTIAIIINVFLIYSGETIFYTGAGSNVSRGQHNPGKKMEVRLSTTIFYIYLIIIFIYALGQYVYSDKSSQIIQMARTKNKVMLTVELIISIFNVIGILFLSYHIYFEIRNLNDTECPYPNQMICHAPTSECSLTAQSCPPENTDYKFSNCYIPPDGVDTTAIPVTDYNNKYKLKSNSGKYSVACNRDLQNFFENNFLVVSDEPETPGDPAPPPPPDDPPPPDTPSVLCVNSNYKADSDCANGSNTLLTKYNESADPCNGPCTQEQCCKTEDIGDLNQDDPRYSWVAREDKLEEVEGEVEQILAKISGSVSGGIAGPPGPPGPPGTPGSDGPLTPPQNLQSNIVCSKDGVCPAGKTKCNDKGQCVENFALISLEEKINLQNKYKDLNHNSYKADKLMNNLEQYLLNTLK